MMRRIHQILQSKQFGMWSRMRLDIGQHGHLYQKIGHICPLGNDSQVPCLWDWGRTFVLKYFIPLWNKLDINMSKIKHQHFSNKKPVCLFIKI